MKYQGPCKSIKEILEKEWSMKPGQKILAQPCSGIILDAESFWASLISSLWTCDVWTLACADQRATLCLTVFSHSLLYPLIFLRVSQWTCSWLDGSLCPPPKHQDFRHMLLHLAVMWKPGLTLKASACVVSTSPTEPPFSLILSFKWHFKNTHPLKYLPVCCKRENVRSVLTVYKLQSNQIQK